jgi:hypothetical protein
MYDAAGTQRLEAHLKKVFWPNPCVGPLFQVLDIHEYASGLKLGPALALNKNPNFEMASKALFFCQAIVVNNFFTFSERSPSISSPVSG